MLKDPKPPMIPKETSLTTHPEASTKMYGINNYISMHTQTYLHIYIHAHTHTNVYMGRWLSSKFS